MSTLLAEKKVQKDDIQTSFLVKMIHDWPDWKVASICLDKSDIVLLEKIKIISNSSSKL